MDIGQQERVIEVEPLAIPPLEPEQEPEYDPEREFETEPDEVSPGRAPDRDE